MDAPLPMDEASGDLLRIYDAHVEIVFPAARLRLISLPTLLFLQSTSNLYPGTEFACYNRNS